MNLPNYINFEPFNRLRRQMRTSQLGTFSIYGKDAPDAAPPVIDEAQENKPRPTKAKVRKKTAAQATSAKKSPSKSKPKSSPKTSAKAATKTAASKAKPKASAKTKTTAKKGTSAKAKTSK